MTDSGSGLMAVAVIEIVSIVVGRGVGVVEGMLLIVSVGVKIVMVVIMVIAGDGVDFVMMGVMGVMVVTDVVVMGDAMTVAMITVVLLGVMEGGRSSSGRPMLNCTMPAIVTPSKMPTTIAISSPCIMVRRSK